MPQIFNWPAPAVCLLVDTDLHPAMVKINADWQKFLQLEAMAHSNAQLRQFLSQIIFLEMPVVRLFFSIVEDDLRVGSYQRSVEMARGLVVRLGDEKPPEDMHQRVRNYQKMRRFKKVGRPAIYSQCQTSRILEDRGLTTVRPSSLDIAKQMQHSLLPKNVAASSSPPDAWPKIFDDILKPSKDWPTASVRTFFDCCLCSAMVSEWDGIHPESLWGCWWARLLVPLKLYRHSALLDGQQYFIPLAVSKFAAMVVMCAPAAGEIVGVINTADRDAVIQLQVFSDNDVDTCGFEAEFADSGGLQLRQLDACEAYPRYLAADACLRRYPWSQWELRAVLVFALRIRIGGTARSRRRSFEIG